MFDKTVKTFLEMKILPWRFGLFSLLKKIGVWVTNSRNNIFPTPLPKTISSPKRILTKTEKGDLKSQLSSRALGTLTLPVVTDKGHSYCELCYAWTLVQCPGTFVPVHGWAILCPRFNNTVRTSVCICTLAVPTLQYDQKVWSEPTFLIWLMGGHSKSKLMHPVFQ